MYHQLVTKEMTEYFTCVSVLSKFQQFPEPKVLGSHAKLFYRHHMNLNNTQVTQ